MAISRTIAKAALARIGLKLVRANSGNVGSGFMAAAPIVQKARARGMSVSDLIALELYPQSFGARDSVITEMASCGCFENIQNICEIGAGTGTYLDPVLRLAGEVRYEVYETAPDWRDWLAKTFGVIAQPTDGFTLAATADKSQDLVHAHAVFVYLPHIHIIRYFDEMARVCKSGGAIVFDYFTLEDFGLDAAARWRETEHRWPVVYPRQWVLDFFTGRGFELIHEFDKPFYASHSRYVVFRRAIPAI